MNGQSIMTSFGTVTTLSNVTYFARLVVLNEGGRADGLDRASIGYSVYFIAFHIECA